ncbi:MAG: methyltransferase domain-containing protein [Chlorobiaceae bacterium]|nr:methyltransferase domain-containing protein [Chlorobiaceae bacterium]
MNLKQELHKNGCDAFYRELAAEYDLREIFYTIQERSFGFLCVEDSYALLDRISPEEFLKDEQMPYWAEIWPAAIMLSSFIARELPLEGKRIIEIGAGVGMVSVVAAANGADVLSTDYSQDALRFVAYNALRNGVHLETATLDWRLVQCNERFDMLFAADVLYERVNPLPVMTAIDKLLKSDGMAWIADPRRRLAGQFLDLAGENGFSITPFATNYEGGSQPVGVNIYRLSRGVMHG